MDREQIIQWAREVDIDFAEYTGVSGRSHIITCGSQKIEKIEAFAKLVAEHERGQCAAECERMIMYPGGRQMSAAHQNVWAAAKAIRERGQ